MEEFAPIPPIDRTASVSEARAGKYLLGRPVGTGQFGEVRACHETEGGASSSPLRYLTAEGNERAEASSEEDGKISCRPRERSRSCSDDAGAGSHSPPALLVMKVVEKLRHLDLTSVRRLAMEIATLAAAQHPNLVALRDVIHTDKHICIVMDFGGSDLFEWTNHRSEGMAESKVAMIIAQLAAALHHLHMRLGVCHRDLKPCVPPTPLRRSRTLTARPSARRRRENVLIDRLGCVRIIDFGLCKQAGWDEMLDEFCGSKGFFAPEMIVSKRYQGFAADVWSAGCIALEVAVQRRGTLAHRLKRVARPAAVARARKV